MTDREGVERITADEAIAALTAGAWHEEPREEDYRNVMESVLSFCAEHEGVPGVFAPADVPIPPAEIRRVIEVALGKQRTIIHCVMSFTGADWDLETATALARRDDAQCAWAPHFMNHDLAIHAEGAMHRFDVRKPVEPAKETGQ